MRRSRDRGGVLGRPVLLSILFAVLAASGTVRSAGAEPLVRAVESVGFTVADLDRSVAFFTDVLTFRKLAEVEVAGDEIETLSGVFGTRARVARLGLGDEVLELTEYLAPRGRPYPEDSRSNDRWFQHVAIVVSDMDAAYRRLRAHHVTHASPGPQRLPDWNPNAGGIEAFYFRDPDGHYLEIIAFPEGKGDPRWSGRTDRLFLGIDHTAIVVEDTERSLRLYRDVLGLEIAGGSENWGIEQERLNNVLGARLRITSLRAAQGPGIEFLEYLTPTTGRTAPRDLAANDLAHWQTRLSIDPARAIEIPAGDAWTPVSADAAPLDRDSFGFDEGVLGRDRDGHGLLLTRTRTEAQS